MCHIPEPSSKMLLLTAEIRDAIDDFVVDCVASIEFGSSETAPAREKVSYQLLGEALKTNEQIDAFARVVKSACIAVVESFFDKIDEGLTCQDENSNALQYYDIVDRETRESVITWSACEEFYTTMPEGYQPFSYDTDTQPPDIP